MKASDSTNSLTALYPDEPECFVCLENANNEENEPVVHGSLLRTCGCKFMVHPKCWNQWIQDKTDFDCPICRKSSLVKLRVGIPPNPVMAVAYQEETGTWTQRHPAYCFCSVSAVVFGLLLVIVPVLIWLITKN